MVEVVKPIAVLQGGNGADIQRLLREFVERRRPAQRIVGLVQDDPEVETDGRARGKAQLRLVSDGRRFPLFQDLGAEACGLHPPGVIAASQALVQDIAAGCDAVVISKFGVLEAERRTGLIDAFAAAIEADVPILTSVAPKFSAAWARFADPLFVVLPPDAESIAAWWHRARRA
jgi:hypothetical protein